MKDVEEIGRQDRPHPAEDRVSKDDKETLKNLRARPEDDGVRPGQGDRGAGRARSSSAAPACASRRSRSATTCSPARPASARPRWRASWPAAWAIELIRFDMSEYMERHTVSRLIGAPPGYVGFDQGGLLTDAIDQHPHCVLLLDEIEKAHPDLFNILLQVMDHGKLTDHNGKTVDFRNVILIMTTNAGAADMAKAAIGFGRERARGRGRGGDQPHVHAGIPQPPGRDHRLRQPDAGDRGPRGRQVRHAARGPARRPQRDDRAVRRRARNGWRRRATTRSTAPGRWPASSRSTSRSRWPRSCCSASWRRAGPSASASTARSTS